MIILCSIELAGAISLSIFDVKVVMTAMWLTYAILSVIVFGLAGWFMKVSQMKQGSIATLLFYLYVFGTLGFAVHMIFEGSYAHLSFINVWLMGGLIGIGSTIGNYVFMKALSVGPASLTSPLTNINIILVVLLGTLVYDETLSILQVISIILLLLATILITQRKEQRGITSSKWYLYIFVAIVMFAIRNGGLKITAQWGYDAAPVLFVAYLVSILFCLVPYVKALRTFHLTKQKNNVPNQDSIRSHGDNAYTNSASPISIATIFGIICGLFSYGGMQLYALALIQGPASLVAPIFATNGLLTALLSIIIYKERLSRTQWIAFVCLFIGIIGIRITF